jgi:hypothetical protein
VCTHNAHIFRSRSFLGEPAPYTEGQLWYLYNEFGASPRDLANYALDPRSYETQVVEQVRSLNPRALRDILISPDSDRYSDLLTVIDPSENSRALRVKTIASRRISEMLDEHGLLMQNAIAKLGCQLLDDSSNC